MATPKKTPSVIRSGLIARPLYRAYRWLGLFVVAAIGLWGSCMDALAQASKGVSIGPAPTGQESEEGPNDIGLPYSGLINPHATPVDSYFKEPHVGTSFVPKLGPGDISARGRFGSGLRYNLPFDKGFQPEKAEIKLGRFYLDIQSLSGSIIHSDNRDLQPVHRKNGVISMVNLKTMGLFQVTEGLRLSVRGSFIYFPFQGEAGIAGFMRDSRFMLDVSPLFQAQVSYDMTFAGWDVELYDMIQARPLSFGQLYGLTSVQEPFDEEDRSGRLVFRDATGGANPGLFVNNMDSSRDQRIVMMQNMAGATASRLIPTDTRARLGVKRTDSWYYNTDSTMLPRSRDEAFLELISERETMRFKPFLSYRIFRQNEDANWDQIVGAGVKGPATENIHVLAGVGYYLQGASDVERFLDQVRIEHVIGPNTRHMFEYRRQITEPESDLEETYRYSISQVMGPYLQGEWHLRFSSFEDLDQNDSGMDMWNIGMRFISNLSKRTSVLAGWDYRTIEFHAPPVRVMDLWTASAILRHQLSPTVQVSLSYQYQDRDMSWLYGYYENMVALTISKFF